MIVCCGGRGPSDAHADGPAVGVELGLGAERVTAVEGDHVVVELELGYGGGGGAGKLRLD